MRHTIRRTGAATALLLSLALACTKTTPEESPNAAAPSALALSPPPTAEDTTAEAHSPMTDPATPEAEWPFDQPRNCATMTMRQVVDGKEPILAVYHDLDDHAWQFMGSSNANVEDGMLVALSSMLELDPTVREVADLKPGWRATRSAPGSPWKRSLTPVQDED